MSLTYNLTDAKARFSEVVDRVADGDEIVVTRMGKPVARIIPYRPETAQQRLGLLEGRIRIAEDFDTWPKEIAQALGMEP
jgi:prevent-host-death family protein